MKKLKVFLIVILAAFCALSMTACEPFSGFDDDNAIIKGSSFSTSVSTTEYSKTKYSLKCNKCNGVKKIKSIQVPDNPVFDISLKIEEGKFKVVLIKDNTVFLITDTDSDAQIATFLEAGTYDLKIVAQDAKVDFTFIFDDYNNKK